VAFLDLLGTHCRSFAKFSDATKASKDLLSKPYAEASKVELKGSAVGGPTFIAETVIGAVPASTPALAARAEGFTAGNFRVDKFGVDSNAVVTAEFSLAEAFKRTKLTFAAKDQTRNTALKEDKRTATATIGAEHRAEVGTFTAEADPLARVASVTALGGYRGFFAGGSVKASLVSFKAEEYGAVVGYKASGATVAIAGEKNFATIAASYHQKVDERIEVAGTAKVPRALSNDVEIAAGFTYKYAADTTVAAKASASTSAASGYRRIHLSYAQQVSPLAKITLSTALDAKDIGGSNNTINVALALSA